MKNKIHVLPTDKPSRLSILNSGKLNFGAEIMSSSNSKPQNIYITSDEEIKEGVDQWYLDKVLNEPYNSGGAQYSSKQDIIILTTDQELIEDGVQAIDDEFLEWFVKNPSCEEVEVDLVPVNEFGSEITVNGYGFDKFKYKIIIPKEELEEAAKKLFGSLEKGIGADRRLIWMNGAKWQQERSYSEEEVTKLLISCKDRFGGSDLYDYTHDNEVKEWFESYKKK